MLTMMATALPPTLLCPCPLHLANSWSLRKETEGKDSTARGSWGAGGQRGSFQPPFPPLLLHFSWHLRSGML